MSRKRPTTDQMGELLSQPHFHHDGANEASHTPVTATPMLIDVDQIDPYDRNPRRAPNDKRDELKAYIQEAGFNQVLTVTQRPDAQDSDRYMVGVGGNTRLTIVQELWHETGDERFEQIWCQFEPWHSEAQTLVAHIQDNDLRGDLVFVDRALTVQELRDMFESESGQTLSQRELRDRLGEYGYKISRTMIVWYQYTVDTLYPLIPSLLKAGMGRTTIARIQDMQRAFGKAWQAIDLGDAEQAVNLFEQVLQRHDGDMLDLDALRRDLEEELSISADCDIQRASLELGGALYGRSDSDAGTAPATQGDSTPTQATEPKPVQPAVPPAPSSPAAGENDQSAQTTTPDSKPAQAPSTPAKAPATTPQGTPDNDHTSSGDDLVNKDATPLPADLKSLRSRTWTLATRIAQGTRFGDVVVSIPAGLGFLVGPIAIETQQAWHPDTGRSAICVWWQLATLAEQFARHGLACEHMPADWQQRRIGQAMRQARDGQQAFSHWQWEQADRELFAEVPPLEPNDIGPAVYQSWSEQRWQDWIKLVDTYRAIYRATEGAPWGNK